MYTDGITCDGRRSDCARLARGDLPGWGVCQNLECRATEQQEAPNPSGNIAARFLRGCYNRRAARLAEERGIPPASFTPKRACPAKSELIRTPGR